MKRFSTAHRAVENRFLALAGDARQPKTVRSLIFRGRPELLLIARGCRLGKEVLELTLKRWVKTHGRYEQRGEV